MTYSEKLRDPRWQKKRLKILERDNFTCRYCNDTETELQVHHKKYNGEPWDAKKKHLITLCKHCHKHIELLNDHVCKDTVVEKEYIEKDGKIVWWEYKIWNSDMVWIYNAHNDSGYAVTDLFIKECLEKMENLKNSHNG